MMHCEVLLMEEQNSTIWCWHLGKGLSCLFKYMMGSWTVILTSLKVLGSINPTASILQASETMGT